MALNQRRLKILDLIREDGHAKVQELSRIFNVTDVTIRQDLEALEKLGYVQREYGGAFLKDVGSFATTGKVLTQNHLEEKQEIAHKAVEFINEGDSLILDSGSTTAVGAGYRQSYRITVGLALFVHFMSVIRLLSWSLEVEVNGDEGIEDIGNPGRYRRAHVPVNGESGRDCHEKDIREA